MRNRLKVSLYILVALIDGIVFASIGTKVTYPCPLLPGTAGCVSFEKAVMHPGDLIANYQGSLTHFLLNLLVVFAIVLILLIGSNAIWVWAEKRKRHLSEQPR
jgi:hypothetical protein